MLLSDRKNPLQMKWASMLRKFLPQSGLSSDLVQEIGDLQNHGFYFNLSSSLVGSAQEQQGKFTLIKSSILQLPL